MSTEHETGEDVDRVRPSDVILALACAAVLFGMFLALCGPGLRGS